MSAIGLEAFAALFFQDYATAIFAGKEDDGRKSAARNFGNARDWLLSFRCRENDCDHFWKYGPKRSPATVIARSEATKQSSFVSAERKLDCFAEPVIGRAFARPVGSQ